MDLTPVVVHNFPKAVGVYDYGYMSLVHKQIPGLIPV